MMLSIFCAKFNTPSNLNNSPCMGVMPLTPCFETGFVMIAKRWKLLIPFAIAMLLALSAFPQLGYSYRLNPYGYRMNSQIWYNASDYFTDLTRAQFREAMSEWNAYLPEYRRLCYNPQTHAESTYPHREEDWYEDGRNRIYKCRAYDFKNLGLNVVWWNSSLQVVESDIRINSENLWSNGAEPNRFDVKGVFKHELGHTVGLEDSQFADPLMAEEIRPNELWRTFLPDDLNGLRALY